MYQNKVFTSGFSDDAGDRTGITDILTNMFPYLIENRRGSGKMNTHKIPVTETDITEFVLPHKRG